MVVRFAKTLLLVSLFGGVVSLTNAQLPDPGSFTPDELLARASSAYQAGNFAAAEGYFLSFERDFAGEEQLAAVITRNKPLIALCLIANGKIEEAIPYLEASVEQPDLPVEILEELSFWLAIQRMQKGAYQDAQHQFGQFFKDARFDRSRRFEALILFGTCYVVEGYPNTAAEFFEAQIPNLRKATGASDYAGRAVVLQMMALLQSEDSEGALQLLREEYPNMGEITQLVSFQTMALQLGSQFMDQERYHDAVACLQRIWPRDRLLAHQEKKLEYLRDRKAKLTTDPQRQSAVFQLDGVIKRVEREIENFQQIADFDAALRFRLALAFQGLERYREAALILEDMISRMDPTPIVETAALSLIQCWSQIERWPKAVEAAE
ncbi:MAG: hypothetical protein AAF191_18320, partial [Verrucomicrobiota bacterium]